MFKSSDHVTIIQGFELSFLADSLKKAIKERIGENCFETTYIVFPSIQLEQWFKTYWLQTEDSVLMNIECTDINTFLKSIIRSKKKINYIKRGTLRNILIKILSLKTSKDILPQEIQNYLYNGEVLSDIKLYDLSDKLSQLYIDYQNDLVDVVGYQKDIFDLVKVECDNNEIGTLYDAYNNKEYLYPPCDNVHIFALDKLSELQKKILSEYVENNNVTFYELLLKDNIDYEYEVMSMPSMRREIEIVHSKICRLIKEEKARLSDFLVLAPDIKKYESTITEVFKQDRVNFPDISHVIIDKSKEKSDISNALKVFIEILHKKFFTRLDFFDIISNPIVKKVRQLSDEQISNFLSSIIELNIYRNRKGSDDWEYAKKRLLLSKLSDINLVDENIVSLSSGDYIPYSNISFDDDSIIKFVKIIDDIKSWLNNVGQIKFIDSSSISLIRDELNKWFSSPLESGLESNIEYKPLLKLLDEWEKIGISSGSVPINTLFYSLMEVSNITVIKFGALFSKGITFTSFDPNSLLSSKYIFFLGASSKELPVLSSRSELDIRTSEDTSLMEQRISFFKQLANASEKVFISYINKNLKSDEDYYPSSFLIDLVRLDPRLSLNEKNDTYEKLLHNEVEQRFDIDEKRSWKELFTKREYKNKEYYKGLLKINLDDSNKEDDSYLEPTYPIKVSISKLIKYLEEPLAFKANLLFGSVDEDDELIKQEYEPFFLEPLDAAIIRNSLARELLIQKNNLSLDRELELKKRYVLEHSLPDICEEITDSAFKTLISESQVIYEDINLLTDNKYELTSTLDLILNCNGNEWILTTSDPICVYSNNDDRYYFEVKDLEKPLDKDNLSIEDSEEMTKNLKDLLKVYVYSLTDIARKDEKEYCVHLVRNYKKAIPFSISPSKAKELLSLIYKNMYDYNSARYLFINILFDDSIKEYEDLAFSINDDNKTGWKYFSHSPLFDPFTQIGYTIDNFDDEFKKAKELLKSLLVFIKEKKEEDVDE